MDVQKALRALEAKGYQARLFATGEDAARYLEETVSGKTVGFGGSRTLTDLRLQERLTRHNTVWNPDDPPEGEDFDSTARKAMATDCYFLSANALSEDGEIVNIDGIGNRLAGSLFGHKRVYYVVGVNKLAENLEQAIRRARNVAAPQNAARYRRQTPCAAKADRYYDCRSPERICASLLIHYQRPAGAEAEVLLINEPLGF